jgi:hypothetical protein
MFRLPANIARWLDARDPTQIAVGTLVRFPTMALMQPFSNSTAVSKRA